MMAVLAEAVSRLKKGDDVMKYAVEAKQLEEEGDAIYHEALGQLFEKEHDAIELIKWKEILRRSGGHARPGGRRRQRGRVHHDQARLMPASVWFVSGDPAGRPHLRLHQRLSRRGELHRHGRVHARAVAERRGGVGGVLELRRGVRLRHRPSRRPWARPDRPERRRFDCGSRRPAGAIIWDLVTWWLGLPTSSSHALIGGYAGRCGRQSGICRDHRERLAKTLIFMSSRR